MTMTPTQSQVVAKSIHEGLRRNGTVIFYSLAFQRIVADAVDAHLAGMGEPVACIDHQHLHILRKSWDLKNCLKHPDDAADGDVMLYTCSPIDLAAMREVITAMHNAAESDDHLLHGWADKLEAAIATQTKELK